MQDAICMLADRNLSLLHVRNTNVPHRNCIENNIRRCTKRGAGDAAKRFLDDLVIGFGRHLPGLIIFVPSLL